MSNLRIVYELTTYRAYSFTWGMITEFPLFLKGHPDSNKPQCTDSHNPGPCPDLRVDKVLFQGVLMFFFLVFTWDSPVKLGLVWTWILEGVFFFLFYPTLTSIPDLHLRLGSGIDYRNFQPL